MKKLSIILLLVFLFCINIFSETKRYSFYALKINENIITKDKVFTENKLLNLKDFLKENESNQNIEKLLFFFEIFKIELHDNYVHVIFEVSKDDPMINMINDMLKGENQDSIIREDDSITILYNIEKKINDDIIIFKDYTNTDMLIIKSDKIVLTGLKKNEFFVIFK